MKTKGLIIFLLALCLSSCKPKGEIESYYYFRWNFVVENATGEQIKIYDDYSTSNGRLYIILPGESRMLEDYNAPGYPRETPLYTLSEYLGENFIVVPGGVYYFIPPNKIWFRMVIDGIKVSNDIGDAPKYWVFEPDPSHFHHGTYTLTVTEELLDSLPPATDDE